MMSGKTGTRSALVVVLALALVVVASVWATNVRAAPATELHVCPGGCTYSSIQEAVDHADAGDVVKVAEGTYTDLHAREGITQVVCIDRSITVQGGYTVTDWTTPDPLAHPTTLNAQDGGRGVVIRGTQDVTVAGLRITGGNADGLGGDVAGFDAGGGVYIRAPRVTLADCEVYGNHAEASDFCCGYGGGVYLFESDYAELVGNAIHDNTANAAGHGDGGGLGIVGSAHVTLRDNTIKWNTGTNSGNSLGGGVYLSGCDYAMLENNYIALNTASTGADASGGGLYLMACNYATLTGNDIESNLASEYTWGWGGGLCVSNSYRVALDGNLVMNNTTTAGGPAAAGFGGGLYLEYSTTTLTNTVFFGNDARTLGGALYVLASSPRLVHTTLIDNVGLGGIYVTGPGEGAPASDVTLLNSIVFSHTVGISVAQGSTATFDTNLWYENAGGHWDGAGVIVDTNNHVGDPLFAIEDYHLTEGSAARDLGADAGVAVDIDGQRRPQGTGYDLGADEYPSDWFVYLPSVMRQRP
jgi:hypothetical protein